MNNTHPKLITDLEIDEKVFPVIDKTTTIYGRMRLREMLDVINYGQDELLGQRYILESFFYNPTMCKAIYKQLRKIKQLEDDINWLFSSDTSYDNFLFGYDVLNIKELLTAKNFLKIYSPSFVVIIYLIIYLILRYKGLKLDIKSYLLGIYNGYKSLLNGILHLILRNKNMISLLTNIFATTYVVYHIYNVYNSCETSLTHYKSCDDFSNRFKNIRQFVDGVSAIFKTDSVLLNEKTSIILPLQDINNILSDKHIKSFGSILLFKKEITKYESKFNSILQYVGTVDAYLSIVRLLSLGYTFPNFDFSPQKNQPYISAENLWCPYMDDDQVLNSYFAGNDRPNNTIITGPNTSGKSTYIRNAMLSILLSQTIGVTCCGDLTFTPLCILFSYMDIPNIARYKESLFEAEVQRCMEYCKMVENLPEDAFMFTIMDELFTGTNPIEGAAGSYAVCDYVGKSKNSLLIVTTHFNELTKLGIKHPKRFSNKKFMVDRMEDGQISRNYVLQDGISDQNIAIELLYYKGYNTSIVDKAMKKIKNLKKIK